MSRFGDAFDKIKKVAGENSEKITKGVEKAANTAKQKTGREHDEKIDKAKGAATEYLRKQAEQDRARREEHGDS